MRQIESTLESRKVRCLRSMDGRSAVCCPIRDAASGEITGAVIGSTLTTVLVFVPLAFIVGVYGQFFASLSWSLSIAVLVSMVISLTLVPVFAAKFLAGRPMPAPGPIYRFVAHIYELGAGGGLAFPLGDACRWRWPRCGVGRGAVHGHPRSAASADAGQRRRRQRRWSKAWRPA